MSPHALRPSLNHFVRIQLFVFVACLKKNLPSNVLACLLTGQVRWLVCEWLSWLLRMSRPGDESKVGSQRHRERRRSQRQMTAKAAGGLLQSPSLIANVRDSTSNGGPGGGSRRRDSTAPTPTIRSASPAFICRCPVCAIQSMLWTISQNSPRYCGKTAYWR